MRPYVPPTGTTDLARPLRGGRFEIKRSGRMKLNSDMVERTLSQIDALEVSEDDPLVHELKTMFGDLARYVAARFMLPLLK
jgi:hypothetical protein